MGWCTTVSRFAWCHNRKTNNQTYEDIIKINHCRNQYGAPGRNGVGSNQLRLEQLAINIVT